MHGNDKRTAVTLGLSMLLIGLVAGAAGCTSKLPSGIRTALELITSKPDQGQQFSACRLSQAQSE